MSSDKPGRRGERRARGYSEEVRDALAHELPPPRPSASTRPPPTHAGERHGGRMRGEDNGGARRHGVEKRRREVDTLGGGSSGSATASFPDVTLSRYERLRSVAKFVIQLPATASRLTTSSAARGGARSAAGSAAARGAGERGAPSGAPPGSGDHASASASGSAYDAPSGASEPSEVVCPLLSQTPEWRDVVEVVMPPPVAVACAAAAPLPAANALSSAGYTCPVCLEDCLGRAPVMTQCGHMYCQTCWLECLNSAVAAQAGALDVATAATRLRNACLPCPVCNKWISGVGDAHFVSFGGMPTATAASSAHSCASLMCRARSIKYTGAAQLPSMLPSRQRCAQAAHVLDSCLVQEECAMPSPPPLGDASPAQQQLTFRLIILSLPARLLTPSGAPARRGTDARGLGEPSVHVPHTDAWRAASAFALPLEALPPHAAAAASAAAVRIAVAGRAPMLHDPAAVFVPTAVVTSEQAAARARNGMLTELRAVIAAAEAEAAAASAQVEGIVTAVLRAAPPPPPAAPLHASASCPDAWSAPSAAAPVPPPVPASSRAGSGSAWTDRRGVLGIMRSMSTEEQTCLAGSDVPLSWFSAAQLAAHAQWCAVRDRASATVSLLKARAAQLAAEFAVGAPSEVTHAPATLAPATSVGKVQSAPAPGAWPALRRSGAAAGSADNERGTLSVGAPAFEPQPTAATLSMTAAAAAPSIARSTAGREDGLSFVTYQCVSGEPCWIHPLSLASLAAACACDASDALLPTLPTFISAPVVGMSSGRMHGAVGRRHALLSHWPLGTHLTFAELDLRALHADGVDVCVPKSLLQAAQLWELTAARARTRAALLAKPLPSATTPQLRATARPHSSSIVSTGSGCSSTAASAPTSEGRDAMVAGMADVWAALAPEDVLAAIAAADAADDAAAAAAAATPASSACNAAAGDASSASVAPASSAGVRTPFTRSAASPWASESSRAEAFPTLGSVAPAAKHAHRSAARAANAAAAGNPWQRKPPAASPS